MLQLVKMQVEAALFFESIEQIYERVFRTIKPRTPVPAIAVQYKTYANANSRIRLEQGAMRVTISDVLETAPAPVQEALASILIAKLFHVEPDPNWMARYRRYLNRADVRRDVSAVNRQRGRKKYRDARGHVYDLLELFEEINLEYFNGLMARPAVGWSLQRSTTILGHYDPSHHVIVISSLLDMREAPRVVVKFVMFHEMLHLRYPTQHKGIRRCVHTPEFKEAERKFADYTLARAQLQSFVERSLATDKMEELGV